ncbi:hypothetical protein D3C83_96680 [compost metagenome]
MVSSVPRKAESLASRSLWICWVPQMKRTEAQPKPHRAPASVAALTMAGWSARPR